MEDTVYPTIGEIVLEIMINHVIFGVQVTLLNVKCAGDTVNKEKVKKIYNVAAKLRHGRAPNFKSFNCFGNFHTSKCFKQGKMEQNILTYLDCYLCRREYERKKNKISK